MAQSGQAPPSQEQRARRSVASREVRPPRLPWRGHPLPSDSGPRGRWPPRPGGRPSVPDLPIWDGRGLGSGAGRSGCAPGPSRTWRHGGSRECECRPSRPARPGDRDGHAADQPAGACAGSCAWEPGSFCRVAPSRDNRPRRRYATGHWHRSLGSGQMWPLCVRPFSGTLMYTCYRHGRGRRRVGQRCIIRPIWA
jgi:hypothetical protein